LPSVFVGMMGDAVECVPSRRTTMAVDPVCKMQVNESKAAATSEYHGKTYYFCAVSCKRKFDENPDKYVKPAN
jgi:YHS domain-containing protein